MLFSQQSVSLPQDAAGSTHVHVPFSPHTPVQQVDEGPQLPPCGWHVWQVLSGLQCRPLQQSPLALQWLFWFMHGRHAPPANRNWQVRFWLEQHIWVLQPVWGPPHCSHVPMPLSR